MNTLFYVVLIVAIVVTAGTYQKYLKAKTQKKKSDEETNAELEKLEQLEERIRVLERIVTEDKHDLRQGDKSPLGGATGAPAGRQPARIIPSSALTLAL